MKATEEWIAEQKVELKKNGDLVDYLIEKGETTRWYYERFLYFLNCSGDSCKYADACVKLMKEEIDEYYRGRQTNNIT